MSPYWLIIGTVLVALLPIIAGLFSSYIKVSVVLSMLRSGLGAQQVPGNLVVMALSLAITFYVMSPVIEETMRAARGLDYRMLQQPPSAQMLSSLAPLFEPLRAFMLKHSGAREIKFMAEMRKDPLDPAQSASSPKEPPLPILLSAFVLSELKEAFAMGFLLILPFLVVDLIVANLLAGLGMFMVSPLLVSLPLKLLLFIVSDGWLLLTRGLITSYVT